MLLKEVLGLQDACFFPGGNTPQGFVCRFEDIMPPERARRVYFIKGGSGVGKSTFMRAVGEHCARAGRRVEYFRCSSDPDSLDGVSVPELGVALMDGTAPHAMDPRLPGVRDFTLDLGRFLSEARLAGAREELERAMARRAACFARAYARLSAAQALYCDAGRALSVALRPPTGTWTASACTTSRPRSSRVPSSAGRRGRRACPSGVTWSCSPACPTTSSRCFVPPTCRP